MDQLTDSGRRQRKKDATYNAIVTVAMGLFDEEGYDQVTMERIAVAADVAKATLYRYFPVKEAILAAYMRRESAKRQPDVQHLLDAVTGTRERLTIIFTGVNNWFAEHRLYLDRYIAYRLSAPRGYMPSDEERSGFHHHLALLLAAGQKEGDVRDDISVERLVGTMGCLHLACLLQWLREPGDSLAATVEPMISLFLDGAAKREIAP